MVTDERRDEELLYHPMTLKELQDRAPLIDWRAHFEDALRIVKRKITEKERVVVYAPEYLTKLTGIVKEYNSTDDGKMCVKIQQKLTIFFLQLQFIAELSFIIPQCFEQLFDLANRSFVYRLLIEAIPRCL